MANTTGQKFGGRTKGATNRTTTEIRERFNLLLDNNLDKLQSDIDQLEPYQRIKTILELAKFIMPTLKATDLNIKENESEDQIDYSKLSTETLRELANAELV